jgi:hypothetical protein
VLLFALSETFEIRPHIVSWAFLGATLWMLERERAEPGRAIHGLPLLFVVWVNTHSFFVLGLVVLAIHLVSCLLTPPRRIRTPLLVTAAASVMACLVSPYFVDALYAPLRDYRILASPLFSSSDVGIVEFRPLLGVDLVQGEHVVLFQPQLIRVAYFVLAAIAVASLGRRLGPFDALITLAFGYLAISATRNFALFFFATLPVVLDGTRHISERLRRGRTPAGRRWLPVATVTATGVLMLLTATGRLFAWQWQPYRLGHTFSRSHLPVDAMALVRDAGVEGRVLNALGDGGFIALTTGLPTYMDGRLFSEDAYRRYVAAKTPDGIARLVAESEPSIAVVRYDATWPWLTFFAYTPGWRIVYADTYRAVFLRDAVARSLPELSYPILEDVPADPFTRDEMNRLLLDEGEESPRSLLAAAWDGSAGYPLEAARASAFYLALGYYGPAAAVARDALLDTRYRVPELYFYLGFALTGLRLEEEAAVALRLYLRDGRTPDLVRAARGQLAALTS